MTRSSRATVPGGQAVQRALDILLCFSVEEPMLSIQTLSKRTGLTPPTTRRLVKALEQREFVVLDHHSRRYRLGPSMIRLGGIILQHDDLCAISLPELKALREATDETAALYWISGGELICVLEVVSNEPIRMSVGMGRRFPLHAGAPGRAILAHLDDRELEEVLAAGDGQWDLPTREGLAEVRKRGYATAVNEYVVGGASMAASVIGPAGRPVAAIDLSGPHHRWTAEAMGAAAGTLIASTERVMRQLGSTLPAGAPS